ncbi:hypothetical protein [Halalkalibacterium halodurans]|uniref:hypothetical protein n=1 Tax=Halalkalibacterium halodurans TaxID=86665 RepID=UPI002E20B2AD|nr:hypothetical protein [Halalkalibacterium halodurans]
MRREKLVEELRSLPKDKKMNEQSKQNILLVLKEEIVKENQREEVKKNGEFMKKWLFVGMNVAVLTVIIALVVHEVDFKTQEQTTPVEVKSPVQSEPPIAEKQQPSEQQDEIPEPNIMLLMQRYETAFWEVVDDKDTDGRLQTYQVKEEVTAHFKTVMSQQLAEWYTDTYIKEEQGELFVRAMDGPVFFDPDESYEKEKITNKKYKISQEPANELLGEIRTIYILVYDGEQWIVDELQSEDL